MNDSILNTIKKLLGITPEYDVFDVDICIHINTVFNIIYQLGYGKNFSITNSDATWGDYLGDDRNLEMIKTYVYLRVRMLFDPPASSQHAEAMKSNISELEWRIFVAVDPEDSVLRN